MSNFMNHFLEFKDDDNYLLEDGEVDPVLLNGFGFNEIDEEQIQIFNYNGGGSGPVPGGFELPERSADTRTRPRPRSTMSNSSSKPRLIKRGRGRPRKVEEDEDDGNFNLKKVKASNSNKTLKYNINYNGNVGRVRSSPAPPKPAEPPEPDPEFKCSICNRVYKYLEHLENHLEIIHFTKIKSKVVCKECDQEFFRLMDLYEHEKQEHSKKAKKGATLTCNYCDELFKTYHLKKKHMIAQHNYVPSTSTSSSFNNSKDKNNDVELTECSICLFSFEDIGEHIQAEHLNDVNANLFDDTNLETETEAVITSNRNTNTTTISSSSTSTINPSTSEPSTSSATSTGTGVICKVCNTTFVSLRVLDIHERIMHKNLIEYASSS